MGKYTVTVSSEGGCQAKDVLWVNQGICVGQVEYTSESFGFEVFPNPADRVLHLKILSDKYGSNKQIKKYIYDTVGKLVFYDDLQVIESEVLIDVEDWASGVYHIVLEEGDKRYSRPVFIR